MKQVYTTVILVFCLQFGFGQIGFQDHSVIQQFPAGNALSFEDIITADIDNDGDLDFVTYGRDTVLWYKNTDENGHFERNIIALDINTATSLDVGDVDGDGDLDVISSSLSDTFILWFENIDGNGVFGPPQIALNHSATYIFLSDIDGDGDVDILFKRSSSTYWAENLDGMGNFGPRQTIVTDNSTSIFLDDIDGDGDDDILTMYTYINEISIYKNLGGGTFSEKEVLDDNATLVSSLTISDVDSDGDLDVIAKHRSTGHSLGWYENTDGFGNFGAFQIILNTVTEEIVYVHSADIDGDNDQDLLLSMVDTSAMLWLENTDGLGNFGVQHSIEDVSFFDTKIITGDFDNDADLDVLLIGFNDWAIGLMENLDSQGTFGYQKIIDLQYGSSIGDLEGADMDSDGDNDVVYLTNAGIVWSENIDGQGLFDNHHMFGDLGGTVRNLKICDIDNDGDNDALVNVTSTGSNSPDTIFWMENVNGDGVYFVPHNVSFTNPGNESLGVYSVDIDGDGDLDILSQHSNTLQFKWFENLDGNGTFGAENEVTTTIGTNIHAMDSGDLDSDGDMDVILVWNNGISWFENSDGQGTFGEPQLILDPSETPKKIFPIDFDGDSDIDILYLSNGIIAWTENLNGEGMFSEERIITSNLNSNSRSIFPQDIDADGVIDILVASHNQLDFFKISSDQSSYLSSSIDYDSSLPQSPFATYVYACDIDGDSDIDVISASSLETKWYENLGDVGNEINGTIRYDLGNNGCGDNGDQNISSFLVIADNGTDSFSTFSQNNGDYSILTGEGAFNVHLANQQIENLNTIPVSHTINFSGLNNDSVANFCLTSPNSIEDLFLSIYPLFGNFAILGQDTTYQLVYGNWGNTTIDGSISFQYEYSKMQFISASQEVSSQTINTLNFDFFDLNPSETRTLDIIFNPLTSNIIGTPIVSTAMIYPNLSDNTPYDNSYTNHAIAASSYDPNDINCLEGDEVLIGDVDKYLHYLIRFQNTGNAPAFNVWVDHSLDIKLDWTTMQLESLSHTGRVEITNETDVSFIFNNINLPDSTNDEPNSHGFIAFKIKPKTDVEVGDVFSAIADIYFDFNPPIITNTATTEIVEPLGVAEFDTQSIKLYPNPTNYKLKITSNHIIDRLSVIDLNGRLLNEIIVSSLDYDLDVSSLTKGVYFLEIQSSVSKITKKFIKN